MPSDEDGMMSLFKQECNNEISKIDAMLNAYDIKHRYPGEDILKLGKDLFKKITSIRDTIEFFKEVYN